MNSLKSKSTRYSIAKNVKILDLVKKVKSRVEICKKYGLAPSTLQTFLMMRKKWSLKATVTQNATLELVKSIHIMRENKILLSGPMMQKKPWSLQKQ